MPDDIIPGERPIAETTHDAGAKALGPRPPPAEKASAPQIRRHTSTDDSRDSGDNDAVPPADITDDRPQESEMALGLEELAERDIEDVIADEEATAQDKRGPRPA